MRLVFIIIFLLVSFPVQAQDKAEPLTVVTFQRALNDMNRLKPLQNPKYEKGTDILKRKIIDNENKVIGDVRDVLVNQDGAIIDLFVSFDRLHLTDPVVLNYESMGITSMADAYRIGLEKQQVIDLYSSLSKDRSNTLYSVDSIMGLPVKTSGGRTIGKIGDFLFNDEKADLVQGIYVSISYKTIRNEGLAVPFQALRFRLYEATPFAVIEQDFSDLMIDYLK